jgi:hypothetical protein
VKLSSNTSLVKDVLLSASEIPELNKVIDASNDDERREQSCQKPFHTSSPPANASAARPRWNRCHEADAKVQSIKDDLDAQPDDSTCTDRSQLIRSDLLMAKGVSIFMSI